jgi:hypothetical protein
MKKIINKKTLLLLSLLLFLPVFSGCFLTPSVNQTPTITSTSITTATVAAAYAYNVNATDPDGDTLTYSLTTNPTGMTINPTTGVINWTPTSTQLGNHPVTVEVSDGSLSVTQSFTIIVSEAEAPIIPPPAYPHVSAITVTTNPVDVTGVVNNGTVTVTLATATAGAEIRYTTDGSTPTASSTLYSAPFSVTTANSAGETKVVKAIGIKAGYTNSAITEKAIVFSAALKEITAAKAIADVAVVTGDSTTLAEIKTALGGTVILLVGIEEVAVPVTWGTDTTPGYNNAAVATYVLIGTIGTLPAGYVDAVDTIATVNVNIVVTDIVVNGDFETGDFTGWTATAVDSGDVVIVSAFPQVQSTIKHSGVYAAYMGDGNGVLGEHNTASIEQIIDIPDLVGLDLKINYRVIGTDTFGAGYDWMKFYIDGAEIFYVWQDSAGWQEFTYDLSTYINTSITLKISAWTADAADPVDYYVDNIRIE